MYSTYVANPTFPFLLPSPLTTVKGSDLTEEQLKELARLQEQKALLERLLAQQRHVRTDVCTCWQIVPVYGMCAYSTCSAWCVSWSVGVVCVRQYVQWKWQK